MSLHQINFFNPPSLPSSLVASYSCPASLTFFSLPPLFFLFYLYFISPPTFSSSSISFVSFTPPLLSSIYSSLHSSLRHNVSLSELPAETKWITSLSWLHHPADVMGSVVYTLVGCRVHARSSPSFSFVKYRSLF